MSIFVVHSFARNILIVCSSRAFCTRKHIRYVDPSSVRWFPGHMRKGIDSINAKMSQVDVVIEVHDSRIPFTGRAESLQKLGQIRPHILLLNKTDLAETVKDLHAFRTELFEHARSLNHNVDEIHFTQLNSPERQTRLLKYLLKSLPKLARSVAIPSSRNNEFNESVPLATAYQNHQSISTMAVGIPNGGKSTLINALRGVGGGGSGGAARVGRMAGQTRSVGHPIVLTRGSPSTVSNQIQWAALSHESNFRIVILDTPGILEPKIRSLPEHLSLCVCGSVDWNQVDHEILVDYLLFWWNLRRRTEYISVLELPGPTDNVLELLSRVCARNSFFAPASMVGGRITKPPRWEVCEVESLENAEKSYTSSPKPDFERAARHILQLFNKGAFGRTTFLPSDEAAASEFFIPSTR